jgi:hypothetical protein
MYDRAKSEVARGERKVQKLEFKEKHLLPLDTSDLKLSSPSTPDLFPNLKPLSATSATENPFDEPPRRRSSSFTEQRPTQQFNGNWNLESIKEMTPPVTPQSPNFSRFENRASIPNGHRPRFSGSTNSIGGNKVVVNGLPKGSRSPGRSPGIEFRQEEIEEKASWE